MAMSFSEDQLTLEEHLSRMNLWFDKFESLTRLEKIKSVKEKLLPLLFRSLDALQDYPRYFEIIIEKLQEFSLEPDLKEEVSYFLDEIKNINFD